MRYNLLLIELTFYCHMFMQLHRSLGGDEARQNQRELVVQVGKTCQGGEWNRWTKRSPFKLALRVPREVRGYYICRLGSLLQGWCFLEKKESHLLLEEGKKVAHCQPNNAWREAASATGRRSKKALSLNPQNTLAASVEGKEQKTFPTPSASGDTGGDILQQILSLMSKNN